MQHTYTRVPASEVRHWTKRMPSWGARVAVIALALSLPLLGAGQAMASPSAGPRPATIPQWIPPDIDHPTPLGNPLPAALITTSTVRGSVISPNQANAVIAAVWTLREQAFETNDRSLMAEFETGPAFEADEVTCGCNTRAVRGPISGESLFVPRQRSFPAAFLAEVKTTIRDTPPRPGKDRTRRL
jgi:hypothetical protein